MHFWRTAGSTSAAKTFVCGAVTVNMCVIENFMENSGERYRGNEGFFCFAPAVGGLEETRCLESRFECGRQAFRSVRLARELAPSDRVVYVVANFDGGVQGGSHHT